MGLNKSKVKAGTPYEDMKYKIRPFDLMFFKGGGFISKSILLLEKVQLGKENALFSHVGMVISSEIIDHPDLVPGRLYIWESTLGGKWGDKVNDIYKKGKLGVQVRDLEEVIKEYDKSSKTCVAWSKLQTNPLDHMTSLEIKNRFGNIFNKYNGTTYDMNLLSLLGALFPKLRCLREKAEDIFKTHNWLFCSELCFTVYQSMGLYKEEFNPSNVVPVDFLEGVDEDGIPDIFNKPEKIIYK